MMPWIVPAALRTLGWFMIFDPAFSPISWRLRHLGVIQDNINCQGNPNLAIGSVCLANIRREPPFFSISVLAGFQAVPPELLEAATVDGPST
jgi:multiple sugar transport system permease protein